MSSMRQVRRRLRALGRSLRPFEQEAESLAQELEDEMNRIEDNAADRDPATDPRCVGHHQMSPKEIQRSNELDELQGIADMAYDDIKNVREAITLLLRPKPSKAAEPKGKSVYRPGRRKVGTV